MVSILINTAVLKKSFATILQLLLVSIRSGDSWWGSTLYNQHPVKFGATRCFGRAGVSILNWHIATRSKTHAIGGRDPSDLSHHPSMHGGHRCCGSAYIGFCICQVMKWPKFRKHTGSTPNILSQHPANFGGQRCFGSASIKFFICQINTFKKGRVTW